MMKIDILTLFPEMFDGILNYSILAKAKDRGLFQPKLHNFRDFARNKHHTVDDYPFGGGGGMVLQVEPMYYALQYVLGGDASFERWLDIEKKARRPRVILTTPQGEVFNHQKAMELAHEDHLVFICGHYEGYDERIREHLVTDELSIGDFVLTGGEIAAMAMMDSIVRLREGVLGNEQSAVTDSFYSGLLEYPQYTRPAEFMGWKVPDVLLSGNHKNIDAWRLKQSLLRTYLRRQELLEDRDLSKEETNILEEIKRENG